MTTNYAPCAQHGNDCAILKSGSRVCNAVQGWVNHSTLEVHAWLGRSDYSKKYWEAVAKECFELTADDEGRSQISDRAISDLKFIFDILLRTEDSLKGLLDVDTEQLALGWLEGVL